jgi:hypothetical protein
MEDDVTVGQGRAADVRLDELGRGVDVPAFPGAQVVDDDDLVAARDERVDEIRPDEPRSPL